MRVITIPSVISAGAHGAARGAFQRKRFMSNRSPIWRSVSGESFRTVTTSRP
jgi:hypothetical protein